MAYDANYAPGGQPPGLSSNGRPRPGLNQGEVDDLYNRIAALRSTLANNMSGDLLEKPQLADALVKQIDEMLGGVLKEQSQATPPPDKGLAALIGLGAEAAGELGATRLPTGVEPYDETVAAERILAVGDLYYLYQHERIGVFRATRKLQELFRAGTVQLAKGEGAYALYQFDRREVLRYTARDRLAAYRRAFGYGTTPVVQGARANSDFHKLFSHFINQVALFWRDKRISDVIRERAYDPTFGAIAMVRRSGLDLRNNLKWMSFGHLSVLRVEVMQLLDEAFRVLGSKDVRSLFGAETAWDVVEEIQVRYLNERPVASPRQRMAIAGREVLRWLAQPHILQTARTQFETLLLEVAEYTEEWLTSAQSMGMAERRNVGGVLPWESLGGGPPRRQRPPGAPQTAAGRRHTATASAETEEELEI